MQTAHLDQIILFKIKRFPDLIHYFQWPKKDFLSLSVLSEIFVFCANHHSREAPVQEPSKTRFNNHALDWEGFTDCLILLLVYATIMNKQLMLKLPHLHPARVYLQEGDRDHTATPCHSTEEPLGLRAGCPDTSCSHTKLLLQFFEQ